MLHIGVDVATKTLSILKMSDAKLISVAEIEIKQTQNLLEFLNAHNIGINQSCGGYAICTTCRIIVTKGADSFGPRDELEAERALERNFSVNERLACQIEISANSKTDIEIIIANSTED